MILIVTLLCLTTLVGLAILLVGLYALRYPVGQLPNVGEVEPEVEVEVEVEELGIFAELTPGQEIGLYIRDGQTMRGTVVKADDCSVTLAGARLLSGDTQTPLGGTIRLFDTEVGAIHDLAVDARPALAAVREG